MAEPMLFKSADTQTVVQVGDQVYLPNTLHEVIVSFLLSNRDSINKYLESKKISTDIISLISGISSRLLRPGRGWVSGQISIKICLEFVPEDQTLASEALDQDHVSIDAAASPLDDLRAT
ncbi:KGK domain-containing protein [Synechococcus sp. W55.2]|jgi:hypothetical protein|uniref:KGK domain-containing protein n=1 Tax=unclassified Synechococcus TaxID=2626047 RepID=UPI0039C2AE14